MIEMLLGALYELTKRESKKATKGGESQAGHGFEDAAVDEIVKLAKDLGLKPNPPRYTPQLPTLSGNQYQYDASFGHEGIMYLIECKRRKATLREHLYYLGARILDHILGARVKSQELRVRGIFLSTTDVGEGGWLYALAYGITIVEPSAPPPEWIISALPEHSSLKKPFQGLVADIRELADIFNMHRLKSAREILRDHRYLCKRALRELEGYVHDDTYAVAKS